MSRPRIRTIKPDTWADEKVGGCLTRDARLLFVVLITLADDEGRLRELPAAILGHGYPYDPDAPMLFEGWLRELLGAGLAERYVADGQTYLTLPGFARHQVINRPRASELPPPDGPLSRPPDGTPHGTLRDTSVNGHGTINDTPEGPENPVATGKTPLRDASLTGTGGLIAGREGKGREGSPPKPPEQARGAIDTQGKASPITSGSPRQRGTNPRRLGARAAETVRLAQAEVAAARLAQSTASDRAEWEPLHAALRDAAAGGSYDLYVDQLELVGSDGAWLVLDAPDDTRPWLTVRFERLLAGCADTAGVRARLASDAEHAGFAITGAMA